MSIKLSPDEIGKGEYVELLPHCFVWRNFEPKKLTSEDFRPLFELLAKAQEMGIVDEIQ